MTADRLRPVLELGSRRAVARTLRSRATPLSLLEIQQLIRHLRGLGEELLPLRLGVIRTVATEPLRPHLELQALLFGFRLELYEAPFGSTVLETQRGSGLEAFRPDCTVVLLRVEDLDAGLTPPLTALSDRDRAEIRSRAVAHTIGWLGALRGVVPGVMVIAILPRMVPLELGLHETMSLASETAFRDSIQRSLAEGLRQAVPGAYLCDLEEAARECGAPAFFDLRLWYGSRYPFSVAGAQATVRRLLTFPALATNPSLKCIVLDADNTLWGGVIGEDGLENLALGPDYPGSVYVEFQRRLLAFQRRGMLLAVCSRNNLEDVLEVLRRHPHQVLKESHFAALAVSWESKVTGVVSLAEQLNLGLESLVFVDDSDVECLAIESHLPEVEVVHVPQRLTELPSCLDKLERLEILQRTEEDLKRTTMYAEDRLRKRALGNVDPDAHLASLSMRMTVGLDDRRAVARVAQLTQKTNQFNLTTHRYTEADILGFMHDPQAVVAHFSLRDTFGDAGIVGVAIARDLQGDVAEIDTFLLSCRVIGRRAETVFLAALLGELSRRGVRRVRAQYVETAKNALVRDFWLGQGFTRVDGARFEADLPLARDMSIPIVVELVAGSEAMTT